MKTTLRTTGILIVAGIATVSAARRPQGKSQPPAPFNACSLLTKQEAAAALGEAVGDAEPTAGRSIQEGVTVSSCEYASPKSINRVLLNVWRASPATATQFHQMYQMVCASKTKDGLAGLGDVACWYSEKHEELQVLKGAIFMSIELRRSGNPTEAIKGVAKAALPRLP